MLRRTFMMSGGATALVPALGLPALAQTPSPKLFVNPMFSARARRDEVTFGDKLRISFLRRMHGKLLPVRTSMTTRMPLQARWTYRHGL